MGSSQSTVVTTVQRHTVLPFLQMTISFVVVWEIAQQTILVSVRSDILSMTAARPYVMEKVRTQIHLCVQTMDSALLLTFACVIMDTWDLTVHWLFASERMPAILLFAQG